MGSSGIRTPTFFLDAYLVVVVPYLTHCLGNSLLAVKMKVYCHTEKSIKHHNTPVNKVEEPNVPKKNSRRLAIQFHQHHITKRA